MDAFDFIISTELAEKMVGKNKLQRFLARFKKSRLDATSTHRPEFGSPIDIRHVKITAQATMSACIHDYANRYLRGRYNDCETLNWPSDNRWSSTLGHEIADKLISKKSSYYYEFQRDLMVEFKSWLRSKNGHIEICRGLRIAFNINGLMQMYTDSSFGKPEFEYKNNIGDESATFEPLTPEDILFTECGHESSEKSRVWFWGKPNEWAINPEKIQTNENGRFVTCRCPRCRFEEEKKYSICCAICGKIISPGETVARLIDSETFKFSKDALKVGESVVTCTRYGCAPGGALDGYWTKDGYETLECHAIPGGYAMF